MSLTVHVIDAFTNRPFAGNPAAVCVLAEARDPAWMQRVAAEMNLSETAFVHPREDSISLRWFTPTIEIKLCGHATLASAHALWETGALPANQPALFSTQSGPLKCRREGDWIEMDFPASVCEPMHVPFSLAHALDTMPLGVARAGSYWLAELPDADSVRALRPDTRLLRELPAQGVIVTARSDDSAFDFVSRFFAPAAGVNEDPVTGSAHCALGPYWAAKLGRTDLLGFQASARGGVVKVGVRGERVLLGGQAVTVSRVELLHDESA